MFNKSLLATLIVIAASIALADVAVTQQTSDDTLFAEGLRSRRLFELAESFCRQRLSDSELDSKTQATLVLELIRTQSARAAVSTGESRDASWAEALKTADEFSAKHPGHPRILLVEVQAALSQLANGRILRQEIEADIAQPDAATAALEHLGVASSNLKKIGREVDRLIPERRRQPAAENELTIDELGSLKNNVRYQIAICNLNRALLYPPTDQVNRIDALNVVLNQLNQLQRETPTELPLWWLAQVARIESFRLLENYADANQTLRRLNRNDAPGNTAQLVLEQEILLAIATGETGAINRMFTEAGKFEARIPQLDLALVQLSLEMVKAQASQKQKWLTQASQLTRAIESQHGPYWGRRAELLLIGRGGQANLATTSSTELDILIRVAEQAIRKDNLEDAFKAFQKAAELARIQKSDGQEFVLTVRAAQILEKQKNHTAASAEFISVARKHKKLAASPAAHLRGCWNWSRLFQRGVAVESAEKMFELKKQFNDLLVEHITFWPESETTNQARIWYGAGLQNQKNWQAAIDEYLAIEPDSPLMATAIAQSSVCLEQHLIQLQAENQSVSTFLSPFLDRLKQIQSESGDNPQLLHEITVIRSRFGLSYNVVSATEIIAELQLAMTLPPEEYHPRENVWLAIALVSNGSPSDEIDALVDGFKEDTALLTECANGLEKLAASSNSTTAAVAEARLRIAELGLKKEPQAIFWVSQRAQALERLGRFEEAVAALEAVAKKSPKSADAQMEFARGLSRLTGVDNAKRALLQWRRVTAKVKPRTENWYEAKYHVALTLLKSGDAEGALKLLEYLKAIPPGWQESSWSSKFDQLFIECQN